MPPGEFEVRRLEAMGQEFIREVDAARRGREDPLPDAAKEVFWKLLSEPNGARDHLLLAIESGNLESILEPYGPGQGMYSAPSAALGINPETLERASIDRSVEYNLNFTLAHESRHARDRDEILAMTGGLRGAIADKMVDPALPHDYTEIVAEYLQRDRVLEQRAELAGLNAHVSKVISDVGPGATLREVYERSPKDMAPYVDKTPGEGFFASDTYAYKPGFVVAGDGLHVDPDHANSLAAMGQYFYDAQNYDWRQGMMACLDAINSAEAHNTAVKDPQSPPRIDFNALGIGAPPDAHCRSMLQHVVDSGLPAPNTPDHPDHAYFTALKGKFPEASDELVAHTMLQAKKEGFERATDIDMGRTGPGPDGRLWVTGNNDHNINIDPAAPVPPMIKTTQALDDRAFAQAQAQEEALALRQEQARESRSHCAVM